jgi:hypothetical protein
MRVRVTRAALGALVVASTLFADPALSQSPPRFLVPTSIDGFVCGTVEVHNELAGIRPLALVGDGYPLWFEQDPALLSAHYTGSVRFNNFLVVGDHASIRFKLFGTDTVETWQRAGTAQIEGRLVSIFNPQWDNRTFASVLGFNRWGWDQPYLQWGEVLPGNAEPGQGLATTVRIAFENLPRVQITKLADDVQFSSHVVNLVLPSFGNGRITSDEYDFSAETVAQKFYAHFEDTYDVLAIVPHEIHVAPFDAFHSTVKSEVRGIGRSIYDFSKEHGSTGTLKAYEVYQEATVTANRTVSHETAHQWGSFIDWNKLNGLVRAGIQPEAHDPLWSDGEALLAGVLYPTRRIQRAGDGWKIDRTPAPATFHPYTQYAMGIMAKERVPEVTLFEKQDQFGSNRVPAIGADVTGPVKTATIYNVIGMLGEREGPTPTEWRRATIVVSRDRALSQREMDYWTFFAQRVEDPNRTGVVNWEGFGSFDLATRRAIDLKTAIRPKASAQIIQPLDVDYPDFPATGWAGIEFDKPVRSRYRTDDLIRLSGRVLARDRSDFSQILLYFYPSEGQGIEPLSVYANISSAGTFVADFRFETKHRGRHALGAYLFWPGASSQYPRSILTTVLVE